VIAAMETTARHPCLRRPRLAGIKAPLYDTFVRHHLERRGTRPRATANARANANANANAQGTLP
jgi:hypothetical protein